MIVTDASVWVSWFVPQDANHAATVPWLRATIQAAVPMVAPGLLLIEVGGAIAWRVDQETARRTVQLMQQQPYLRLLTLDALGVQRATATAIDLRLKGADAVYVAVAERLGVPLCTWDGEQRTRGGARIPVYTPDNAS